MQESTREHAAKLLGHPAEHLTRLTERASVKVWCEVMGWLFPRTPDHCKSLGLGDIGVNCWYGCVCRKRDDDDGRDDQYTGGHLPRHITCQGAGLSAIEGTFGLEQARRHSNSDRLVRYHIFVLPGESPASGRIGGHHGHKTGPNSFPLNVSSIFAHLVSDIRIPQIFGHQESVCGGAKADSQSLTSVQQLFVLVGMLFGGQSVLPLDP